MTDKPRAEYPLDRIGLRAVRLAEKHNHEYATLEHLLHSVLDEEDVIAMFNQLSLDIPAFKEKLDQYFSSAVIEPLTGSHPSPTLTFEQVVFRAASTGLISSKGRGDAIDILLAMMKIPPEHNLALILLTKSGLTELAIKNYVTSLRPMEGKTVSGGASSTANAFATRVEAEQFLAQYCSNLNHKASIGKIDPVIGRVDEIDKTIQIFSRKKKNNPLLIGEPGVGKTAVAEGIAHKINANQVPRTMRGTTIYSLDLGALLAGTKYRGDFEERLNKVVKAIEMIPKAVLFIDEIHMIMGAGSTSGGSMDAANLLKPGLSDGSLRVIGSTTFEEYRKHVEKDRALARRFGRVTIEESSVEDSKKIMRGLIKSYENHHGIRYDLDALDAAVDLTYRFVQTGMLPDKAIDIIDMAGARLALDDNRSSDTITVQHIEQEVSRVVKIPEKAIGENEMAKLGHLREDLSRLVFGQEKAIMALTSAVFIARAGLRDEDKTQGSYLFTGPSGCGKTEVAKQLAHTLGIPIHRFDMSEYMEKHSISKLIGAPPGYVGFDEAGGSGLLTGTVEKQPHCVLLLDEIEKAHPDVFSILLQVMDAGRLTDSGGKTVDFRNVWLIMTSNAGVREGEKASIGFGSRPQDYNHSGAQDAIKRMFTPEFRNRLDALVPFESLGKEHIRHIAEKFIDELALKVSDRKIKITVQDSAYDWLVSNGFDQKYGARPMKRLISDKIKEPLARMIVLGELDDGGRITVSEKSDALVLKKTKR